MDIYAGLNLFIILFYFSIKFKTFLLSSDLNCPIHINIRILNEPINNFLKIYIDSYLTDNGLKGKVEQSIGIGDVFTFISNNSEYNISFEPKLITSEGELSFNNNFLNLPPKKGKLIINGDEPSIYFEDDGEQSDLFEFIK